MRRPIAPTPAQNAIPKGAIGWNGFGLVEVETVAFGLKAATVAVAGDPTDAWAPAPPLPHA